MATHAITSTAEQETLLASLVAKHNAENGTELTNTEYAQRRFDRLMNEAAIKDRDRRFGALTDAQKDTALTAGEA
jgi:hypothetical protein